jgi:hypothetical protein
MQGMWLNSHGSIGRNKSMHTPPDFSSKEEKVEEEAGEEEKEADEQATEKEAEDQATEDEGDEEENSAKRSKAQYLFSFSDQKPSWHISNMVLVSQGNCSYLSTFPYKFKKKGPKPF